MKNKFQRTCIGCGLKKQKHKYVRIVKNKTNNIEIDKKHLKQGRGAYICQNIDCLEKAEKCNKIDKSFKQKIDIEIYKELRGYIIGEK